MNESSKTLLLVPFILENGLRVKVKVEGEGEVEGAGYCFYLCFYLFMIYFMCCLLGLFVD